MLKIAKEFPVKKLFPIFSTDSEMKTRFNFIRAWRYWACAFAAIVAFLANTPAQSQPTILSVTPTNLSTGVSITNPVIITFSESMDVSNSGVAFFDETMFGSLSVSLGWSANNTVLTCTPDPPFPSESEILWVVDAHDTNGNAVEGSITGFYHRLHQRSGCQPVYLVQRPRLHILCSNLRRPAGFGPAGSLSFPGIGHPGLQQHRPFRQRHFAERQRVESEPEHD